MLLEWNRYAINDIHEVQRAVPKAGISLFSHSIRYSWKLLNPSILQFGSDYCDSTLLALHS